VPVEHHPAEPFEIPDRMRRVTVRALDEAPVGTEREVRAEDDDSGEKARIVHSRSGPSNSAIHSSRFPP